MTNTSDSGPGSLRQAILDANDAFTMARNTIAFNIPGNGIQVISPVTPLPDISNSVYVNGFTQPGSQPNTSTNSVNAVLTVRIDGATLGGTNEDGVTITGNNVLVRGLIVTRFTGAGIAAINTTNVVVTECFLGVIDAAVTAASPIVTPLKKINVAASGGDEDPYANFKTYGNRYGLRVYGGRTFSTAPLIQGIVGLLIAGNSDQGALLSRVAAAQLLWAYIIYNGAYIDPCSGGILLRGTSGAVLQYLWIYYNLFYGIQIENGRNTLNTGLLMRYLWLRFNSLPGMGAAILANKTSLGTLDNSWVSMNLNHGVHVKDSTSTSGGPSCIYGTMIMRNGGAAVLLERSYYADFGGSSDSQKNTFSLNGAGPLSYLSADFKWDNNIFGTYNTPQIIDPLPPARPLTATRTDAGGDTVVTVSGKSEPNKTVTIVIYKGTELSSGPAYAEHDKITTTTDANGNFSTTYRQPGGITSEIGVMAVYGFLDVSEFVHVTTEGAPGDLNATVTGPSIVQVGKATDYVATLHYTGSTASPSAAVQGKIQLPAGFTVQGVSVQGDSTMKFSLVDNTIVVTGTVQAGETVNVTFKLIPTQIGGFDFNFSNNVTAGNDSIAGNNNAQLHVQVVGNILDSKVAIAINPDRSLRITFDSDNKLESTIDLGSGNWQRSELPSPMMVDPSKPMEFFRSVRPTF